MSTRKSFFYSVFLLRISLPVVAKIDYSDEYKREQDRELGITTTELPEYSEYLRRLKENQENEKNSPLHAPHPFPSIQLCKERPADGDYYGHIFCWTMVALFSMSIVSLIIYQLRSILWLKFAFSRDRQQRKEFELIVNGQQTDYKDNEEQPNDKKDLIGWQFMQNNTK